MKRKIIVVIGGFITAAWGIAHLFPTSSVVRGFGEISADNQHIITMEWINEGLTLIFIGVIAAVVAFSDDGKGKVARRMYILTSAMLIVMSVLSLFTGFQVNFIPFKLCPLIFSVSALMIIQGIFRKG